jgi:hypothetical protein
VLVSLLGAIRVRFLRQHADREQHTIIRAGVKDIDRGISVANSRGVSDEEKAVSLIFDNAHRTR